MLRRSYCPLSTSPIPPQITQKKSTLQSTAEEKPPSTLQTQLPLGLGITQGGVLNPALAQLNNAQLPLVPSAQSYTPTTTIVPQRVRYIAPRDVLKAMELCPYLVGDDIAKQKELVLMQKLDTWDEETNIEGLWRWKRWTFLHLQAGPDNVKTINTHTCM